MTPLSFLSANELADLIHRREISSLDLTGHFIRRIEQFDDEINAVVVRDFDRALAAAAQADKKLASGDTTGPLHGVPVTVKDAFDVSGLATTWGIPSLKENIADTDAEAVRRLKRAGAVLLGKTNVPFALGDLQAYNELYGVTNNPWDRSRSPGGSSGGSAAALAAGFSALELGSDMGGSIRMPAHCCGLYGHKPTWGIVPVQGHGLPGMVAPLDMGVPGPMARHVEDLELAMDVLIGPHVLDQGGWQLQLPRPAKKSIEEYRVAIWPDHELAPVDVEISDRVVTIGETLAELGAHISDKALPDIDFKNSQSTYLNLMWSLTMSGATDEQYQTARQLADAIPADDMSDAAVTARARVLCHRDWLHHNNQREQMRFAWQAFFDEWDILICPVFAVPAFAHDHSPIQKRTLEINDEPHAYLQSMFWAGVSTLPYLPSTVFPSGLSKQGLPIGLQAIGAGYDDYTTIHFAKLLTERIGGFQIPPAYESK